MSQNLKMAMEDANIRGSQVKLIEELDVFITLTAFFANLILLQNKKLKFCLMLKSKTYGDRTVQWLPGACVSGANGNYYYFL